MTSLGTRVRALAAVVAMLGAVLAGGATATPAGAATAASAFTAAPGQWAAGAVVHHITAAPPRTGFRSDIVCDLGSVPLPTLCMSGFDGEGGIITGVTIGSASQLNMDEFIATQNCNNGLVSDGAPGEGSPCPFRSGSGLNTKFNNDTIVELLNDANGKNYAAFQEPFGWGVIEELSGNGQLWVQVGDLAGTTPDATFVNVLVSNSDSGGQDSIVCANGNGNPLRVELDNGNPPENCRWARGGHA